MRFIVALRQGTLETEGYNLTHLFGDELVCIKVNIFASGLPLANMSLCQIRRDEGGGVVFNFIGTFCGICHLNQL